MKKIVLTFLFVSTSFNLYSQYKCQVSVDPKKVVLFLDTNLGHKEVEEAAKAACSRGETFKMIPSWEYDKSIPTKLQEINTLKSNYNAKCDYKNETSECKTIKANIETKKKEHKNKIVSSELLNKTLSNFATNNIAVTSIIASGHDGGGSIHGAWEKGVGDAQIDKTEIVIGLKTAYKNKPNLLNQFHSVYMWGCWTMGPGEVSYWKESLPSLKMAGGFFDMGPLAETLASRTVLHDLLIKEKKITNTQDKNLIKSSISSVENINQTYASVYVQTSCGKDYLYYNTKGVNNHEGLNISNNPKFTPGNHFVEFDKTFNCNNVKDDLDNSLKQFMKYYNGELPIPKDTSNGELRKIYSFSRSNSHCIKTGSMLDGDRILMMVFFENVKKNFANVFSSTITAANQEFNSLNNFLGKYNPKGLPMKNFKDYFMANKSKYFEPTAENLATKSRKDIKNMISFLTGLTNQSIVKTDKKFHQNVDQLIHLKNAMETYLYQLDPACMDFLEWHEYESDHKPIARCGI